VSAVSEKPVIYQLVVRYFSNTNQTNKTDGRLHENGCGKFNEINDTALEQIKNLGCTHLFLTGCLRQATLTDYSELGLPADDPDIVKGRAGSMYAIRDYFDVCPDYAMEPKNRILEFEALVERIHKAKMKVLIDFVPNHVARSYSTVSTRSSFGATDDQGQFFSPENNFFYLTSPPNQRLQLTRPAHWSPSDLEFDGLFADESGEVGKSVKVTGNNVADSNPPVDAWYEVIKLNYGFNFIDGATSYEPPPKTWLDMDEVLRFWQDKGVDGFRCDFAHYVPQEAWHFLLERAREKGRNPDAYFIAEAYPWKGSGDPITDKQQLIDAGFNAIYSGESYRLLKNIYRQWSSIDDYDGEMKNASEKERLHSICYIENHDEVRVAAPVDKSGFGSLNANYQLAPLQYLYSSGAIMLLNGQEVGEPGDGEQGFSTNDGRTTIFDYWCMPEFTKWVNGHRYNDDKLSLEQKSLKIFLADLLKLCQDASIRGSGYWSLRYFNRRSNFSDCPDDLYSFARFQPAGARLLVVVANLAGTGGTGGKIRIPAALSENAGLRQSVTVSLVLDRRGSCDIKIGDTTNDAIERDGFAVDLAEQSACVYRIE
jgi:glycosidase